MSRSRPDAVACALALCALIVAGFAGCGSGGDDTEGTTSTDTSSSSGSQQFTDLNQPIEVGVGETFEVVLDSNPTTGYSWRVEVSSGSDVVELKGEDYEPDPVSEDVVGGGGKDTFTFEAAKAGAATITFEYLPPGEPDKPAETKTAKVTVG